MLTLSADLDSIITRSAIDLGQAISRRELTSSEVVEAHIERLQRSAPVLNAVVADRFEAARERARQIDQSIAQSSLRRLSEELPPLIGVPFTVKESIQLEDMPHSAGVLARRDVRADRSATVVKRLRDAGAIPLAVTNTSELTLWIESENPVYGRTNNPYDPARAAGGSSGGEGAVVGVGGSPFGVGSDIGGSIRIPALFCGIFGHKPSAGLVPGTGIWPTARGERAAAMLATGLLTRRAEDLMPLLRLVAGPDGQDRSTVTMELGDPATVTLDGLVITVITDRGPGRFARELLDARERAVGALASAGARIREVALPGAYETIMPFLSMLTAGSDRGVAHELLDEAGEPSPSARSLLLGDGRHTVATRLTLALERLSRFLPPRMVADQVARAEELAAAVVEAIGEGVVLHPAFPTLAPRHRRTYGRPWVMMPSALFNLAGVPVTEVPMGLTGSGLPTGIQVAAPQGADHLSIAVAIELEAVFGGWRPPVLRSAAA